MQPRRKTNIVAPKCMVGVRVLALTPLSRTPWPRMSPATMIGRDSTILNHFHRHCSAEKGEPDPLIHFTEFGSPSAGPFSTPGLPTRGHRGALGCVERVVWALKASGDRLRYLMDIEISGRRRMLPGAPRPALEGVRPARRVDSAQLLIVGHRWVSNGRTRATDYVESQ